MYFSKTTHSTITIPPTKSFKLGADFSVFESELNDVVPVVYTSIAGCRIIGKCVTSSLYRCSYL